METMKRTETTTPRLSQRIRARGAAACVAALVFLTASFASAETLLMPKREGRMGVPVVVWGITTLPNGTAFTLDFGDGSQQAGNVADRSYIAFQHTYATAGTKKITLTVGGDPTASELIDIFDPAVISAFDNRALGINMAIQDGLRYLWTVSANRTTFDTNNQTSWTFGGRAYTALTVLAFENHGYLLPNNNNAPTGIYPKYVVQRGLNYIFDQMAQLNLTAQPAGDPCVNVSDAPAPCTGLYEAFENSGYSTAVLIAPIAASNALSRTVAGIPGTQNAGFVVGKTYGEILQRLINSAAFGQNDAGCIGQGGWIYGFSNGFCQQSDGSTNGWDILAFLDGRAALGAANIPGFVIPEFRDFALPQGSNDGTGNPDIDGTFDYRADNTPSFPGSVNVAKTGIRLQGLFWTGAPVGDPRVQSSLTYVSNHWTSVSGQSFACNNGVFNKGCGYGMFNVFKALKLYGVQTLPGVNRPAGPGNIPANDWHADYEDYLVATQSAPNTTAGGQWPFGGAAMAFSCCGASSADILTVISELILAPTALIPPDPTLFSTVGLSPQNATNPPGTSHTVTATVLTSGKQPIAGVTVEFEVMTGQNAGKSGSGQTNANGQTTFTYDDTGAGPFPQTDTIQAFIGDLASNIVSKTWAEPTGLKCDADSDGDVDMTDLNLIRAANGQMASGPTDPKDGNSDGKINVADVRYCQLRMTGPGGGSAR